MSRRSSIIPVAVAVLVPVAVVLALASGEAEPRPLLSVTELKRNHEAYDGKLVRVRGWVDACGGEGCTIASMPNYTERILSDPAAAHVAMKERRIGALSIGEALSFERKVSGLLGREIVMTARFNAACSRPDMWCLDRSAELEPVDSAAIMLAKDL